MASLQNMACTATQLSQNSAAVRWLYTPCKEQHFMIFSLNIACIAQGLFCLLSTLCCDVWLLNLLLASVTRAWCMVSHSASCSQTPLTFTPYALSVLISNYFVTLPKACSVLFHGTGALDHFRVCNNHCKLFWKLQGTNVNRQCPTFCGACWSY